MPKVTKSKRPMGKRRLLELLAKRQFAYSLLKRAFIENPTEEFLKLLIEENLLEHFPGIDQDEQIKEGVEIVSFSLKDPDLFSKKNLEELEADYINLFIGPGEMAAAPYESLYRSRKRWVFQEHTMQVRVEYLRQKLMPERYQQEPDDHIALELDFMHHLCQKARQEVRKDKLMAARKTLNIQKEFFTEHLIKWAPQFSSKVIEKARTDFYRGVGKITLGFLHLDQEQMEEIIKQVGLRIKKEREKKRLLDG